MLLLSLVNRLLSFREMAKFHFCVFFLVFVICASKADEQVYSGEVVIKEDEPFNITCRLTAFETLKWQKDGVNIVPSESNNIILEEFKQPGGGLKAVLSVSKAHVRHSASGNSIHILQPYKPLTLSCNVDNAGSPEVTWLKGGEAVILDDHVKLFNVSTLHFTKATEANVGNYTCVVNYVLSNGEKNPVTQHFVVIVRPSVWLPKTINIVEGDQLFLNCSVAGIPTPTVVWEVANVTLEESTDHIILEDDRGVKNAILIIKETLMSDRGDYKCKATNQANTTVAQVYVRVKDKLAALWPFLGICAEVFVLCTIILIYEKKRNKAELEESDTDQSPEQKNTPDMSKDADVRHRK